MEQKSRCYLRTHRKMSGLTQSELAALLGSRHYTHVIRLEKDEFLPRIEEALACEVLFGISPSKMFPRLYEQIEEGLLRRAYDLYEKLENQRGARATQAREFLEISLKRAVNKQ